MVTSNVYPYSYTESREKRVAGIQRSRMRVILVLNFLSLTELATVFMGYYAEIPVWLTVICITCVFINLPLIWWLADLWWRQCQREKQIRKQYKG